MSAADVDVAVEESTVVTGLGLEIEEAISKSLVLEGNI